MTMRIDIITAFPGLFSGFLAESMMARGIERGVLSVTVHDLRDWADDPHRVIDDAPFGGGGGMVLKTEPIVRAVEAMRAPANGGKPPVCVIPTPRAPLFRQSDADDLAAQSHLIFVSGHYTGIDERVFDFLRPRRFALGDYVLSGGELPTMVIIEATARRLSGFLGNDDSAIGDSFVRSDGGLGHPHYTRPAQWRGMDVPPVLISGHHADVAQWRVEQAQQTTRRFRPDLCEEVIAKQSGIPYTQ